MPEGPEVCAVADAVEKGVGGWFEAAVIVENVPDRIHRFTRNGIKYLDKLQKRWQLVNVYTKGKLIRFDVEVSGEGLWCIYSTLGMSGDWRWNAGGHKHARISFLRSDGGDLTFVDTRCYGTLRVVAFADKDAIESRIGWDLLQAPMPAAAWLNLKTYRSIANKPVAVVLLEQKYFSGIGNIYKCETLYSLSIDPRRLVRELTDAQWAAINPVAHQILQAAYALGGSSIRDYTADGVEGSAQETLQVYGRDRCPKGHTINQVVQKDRTTWWCAVCQTG